MSQLVEVYLADEAALRRDLGRFLAHSLHVEDALRETVLRAVGADGPTPARKPSVEGRYQSGGILNEILAPGGRALQGISKSFTPHAIVQYELPDGANAYASNSEGTRPAGSKANVFSLARSPAPTPARWPAAGPASSAPTRSTPASSTTRGRTSPGSARRQSRTRSSGCARSSIPSNCSPGACSTTRSRSTSAVRPRRSMAPTTCASARPRCARSGYDSPSSSTEP